MLSHEQYEEFILPYEQELCEFHGGIRYWHSCGDTGNMVNSIRKIPQIDLFHIGLKTFLTFTTENQYQILSDSDFSLIKSFLYIMAHLSIVRLEYCSIR